VSSVTYDLWLLPVQCMYLTVLTFIQEI
jgi:hypothetical protein